MGPDVGRFGSSCLQQERQKHLAAGLLDTASGPVLRLVVAELLAVLAEQRPVQLGQHGQPVLVAAVEDEAVPGSELLE